MKKLRLSPTAAEPFPFSLRSSPAGARGGVLAHVDMDVSVNVGAVSRIPTPTPLQGYDFFRKERPLVFAANFTVPTQDGEAYGLTSHTIFEAKNYAGEKRFTVTVGGKQKKLIATVLGQEILITSQTGDMTPLRLSEATFHDTLTLLPAEARANSILYQVAKKLCQDHATSSASSPLISGTIVNNFDKSLAYDGFKIHLLLRHRQPFVNPFASGLEKEYFLIGRVLDTDCVLIRFLGRTQESKNELVNFFGSQIPRPSGI